MTTTQQTKTRRHPEADTSLMLVERSDAIDAVAGLQHLARDYRRQVKLRANAGFHNQSHRAWLRSAADVYEDAARRMQRAADDALRTS